MRLAGDGDAAAGAAGDARCDLVAMAALAGLLDKVLAGLGGGCESDGRRAAAICALIEACILNDVD